MKKDKVINKKAYTVCPRKALCIDTNKYFL